MHEFLGKDLSHLFQASPSRAAHILARHVATPQSNRCHRIASRPQSLEREHQTDARRNRILIVDDEPSNVQVLAEVLQTDFDLSFALSGTQALQLLRTQRIDLMLLDVQLPDLNGYQVLAKMKSHPSWHAIPVIFVTSQDQALDESQGLEAGAADYITKPAHAAVVRARVRTQLELKRQRDLLAHLAFMDGLTGIANRRRFEQFYAQLLASHNYDYALALIDVDDFKAYNDVYGHLKGDEVLRNVAKALESCPGAWIVARFGGEEFSALLPIAVATQWAYAALASIAALAIPNRCARASSVVSISMGVYLSDGGQDSHLARADALLYQAKSNGRNRALIQGQSQSQACEILAQTTLPNHF
jgi:diguanylate cyclase (GGDEF)-like protein